VGHVGCPAGIKIALPQTLGNLDSAPQVKAVVVPTGKVPREKRLDGGEEEEE